MSIYEYQEKRSAMLMRLLAAIEANCKAVEVAIRKDIAKLDKTYKMHRSVKVNC